MNDGAFRDAAFLGIDVGTASVRAALFDGKGRRLGFASSAIQIFRPEEDFVEQSSDDIWRACGKAVAGALRDHPRSRIGFKPIRRNFPRSTH